jgi:hypothetical protein
LADKRNYTWQSPPIVIPRPHLKSGAQSRLADYLCSTPLAVGTDGQPDTRPLVAKAKALNAELGKRMMVEGPHGFLGHDVYNKYILTVDLGEYRVESGSFGSRYVVVPCDIVFWDEQKSAGSVYVKLELSVKLSGK